MCAGARSAAQRPHKHALALPSGLPRLLGERNCHMDGTRRCAARSGTAHFRPGHLARRGENVPYHNVTELFTMENPRGLNDLPFGLLADEKGF